MFEQYTDEARRVVIYCQNDARKLGHPLIGTEHLLLGMTHDDVHYARVALNDVGLNHVAITKEIQKLHRDELEVASGDARPLFTLGARRVYQTAYHGALERGDRCVNSGHLLVALIQSNEGAAANVIREAGVDCSTLQERAFELMPNNSRSYTPEQQADLLALIKSRRVTKAKLIQAFSAVAGSLSDEEIQRARKFLE